MLRIWFVPASRSQVTFPSQAGALTKLVAPPRVAISARIPSMADCRVTCRLLRSPAVAKGPGVLEGEDLRVVPVQAGVPEGQRGVHRGLLDEGQQGHCDELTDVRGRGPEAHRGGEVAGAGHGEESRGDGLGDVAGRLGGPPRPGPAGPRRS